MTHREDDLNDEKKELSSIQETITKQLKSYCQLTAIPMFCISNSLFEKGMKNKKEVTPNTVCLLMSEGCNLACTYCFDCV